MVSSMATNRTTDEIDAALLGALVESPNATGLALSETTGLSRNTVRARLARYDEEGTLRSMDRRLDPAALGYPLRAYLLTTVRQRELTGVAAALAAVPEVLEVTGLTGVADLLVHVVARDADDLYRIAGVVLAIDGVKRTTTGLVMTELVPYRSVQLIRGRAADD